MQIYNRDDYNGARIVSRACELRDSVCYFVSLWIKLHLCHCFQFLISLEYFSISIGAWDAIPNGPSIGCFL